MNATPTKNLTAALKSHACQQWARTSAAIAIGCAGCRAGRVLLHVLCACGDHQFKWHLHGITREFARQVLLAS